MNDLLALRDSDLIDNPTPRLPVVLCLDVSSSMKFDASENSNPFVGSSESKIERLNKGLKVLFDEIKNDEKASLSAEICIVTFGSTANKVLDFTTVSKINPPVLSAYGYTSMGDGVSLSLQLLEERKNKYKKAGREYYQPWLVLMTDGMPTDDINSAAKKTRNLVNSRKLTVFPIMVGHDAVKSTLSSFSPKTAPVRLKDAKFSAFFQWLSKSISQTSRSNPGDRIKLDTESLKGWVEIDT